MKENTEDRVDKLGRTGAAIGGRPRGSKSSRTPRQKKLAEILNKLDPLLAKAINKAEAILDADLEESKVSATVQLQAVKLIVDKAIELRNECYKPDVLPEGSTGVEDEEEETGAVLSFTVVDGKK